MISIWAGVSPRLGGFFMTTVSPVESRLSCLQT
jgi:hypothetical protein